MGQEGKNDIIMNENEDQCKVLYSAKFPSEKKEK